MCNLGASLTNWHPSHLFAWRFVALPACHPSAAAYSFLRSISTLCVCCFAPLHWRPPDCCCTCAACCNKSSSGQDHAVYLCELLSMLLHEQVCCSQTPCSLRISFQLGGLFGSVAFAVQQLWCCGNGCCCCSSKQNTLSHMLHMM
jgi:hypothetical protein